MTAQRLQAVVFDFDGVLVDTEPLHYRAFQAVLEPDGLGYSWEAYTSTYIGFDDRDALRHAYRDGGRELTDEVLAGLIRKKAAAFLEIISGEPCEPYPGVEDLIQGCLVNGVPLAICSGALRSDIEPILQKNGWAGLFPVQVTAEDVEKSKPHPASYQAAVEQLSGLSAEKTMDPQRVVAIEDTPLGLISARDAGLRLVAVGTTHRASDLQEADLYTDSLASISVEDLAALTLP